MSLTLLLSHLRMMSLLLFCIAHSLHGLTVWTDTNTPDALDDDVLLSDAFIRIGLNSGGSGDYEAYITSMNVNVNVTMNSQATTVAGSSNNNGAVADGSRLYLQTINSSSTITFIIDQDLTFMGSDAIAALPLDLLIIVRGPGKVIFEFDGGNTVTLTKNLTAGVGGAVQMYVQQDTGASDAGFLQFSRSATDVAPTVDVETVVEGGSIVSYLGVTAQPGAPTTELGTINWEVFNANVNAGRMILTLGTLGAVIVRGRLTTNTSNTSLADIQPQTPAGYNALFTTNMSGSPIAGNNNSLLIQNYNNTLGEFIWDPWDTLLVRENPPFGNFNGVQWGFIIGSYGELNIATDSYFDYVGLTGTQCPPGIATCQAKARSASALFTDGQPDPTFIAPLITINSNAGLFFRSGVDCQGHVRPLSDPNPYTVDPTKKTCGAGVPVFDIEGPLTIVGANSSSTQLSEFELLSLEVAPTGGSLFVGDGQTIFPLRTFTKVPGINLCTGVDETVYLTYNNACFLNNGRANLCSVSFSHTDQNHRVIEENDVLSEPAYIGGETWKIIPCITRPKWAFANSVLNVQTSVALTGVDLLTPENSFCSNDCIDNVSTFYFYQNGYKVDNGNGRQMILGTAIGSTACDSCSVIDKDAQFDVMQTASCNGNVEHHLYLANLVNDHTIVEAIPIGQDLSVLANQYSVQTIYLGNNSNISVGTQGTQGTSMEATLTTQYNFALTTDPTLTINGNFFSFETRGGQNGLPATSNVTGQGGIFVDTNGTFNIGSLVCGYRTNIGTMVTGSSNGIIDLPKNRVFFDPTVGIATWNVNLANQTVIIPNGVCYSDYNLNWMFTQKDYDIFTPYAINCYDVCSCPQVTEANVSGIPTVQGSVQQLQIQGSRIGDPAHLKIDGGIVGELVMLVGFNSAEAPVAVVVLQNNAAIGLGSAHRNVDSLAASVQLGVNGINLIVDGKSAVPGTSDVTVILNEDVIINNVCSILAGPNIAPDAIVRIDSACCKTLRITADGVLDLSSFTTGQTIEFGGNVRVIFEPGATVLYGAAIAGEGPTLRFADEASCLFEPVANLNGLFNTMDLTGTDTVRVVFSGIGVLEFIDCSIGEVPRDAFVGVQSVPACQSFGADIRLKITDKGSFHIGNSGCGIPGGVLQIGNTVATMSPVITFSLILDGPTAMFDVGPQGFFGAGVGIASKPAAGHNSWLIAPTSDVQKISFDLRSGGFIHSEVYDGSDASSSLIALSDSIGNDTTQVFDFSSSPIFGDNFFATLLSNSPILGGGNFIAVANDDSTPFNPIVNMQNGFINSRYTAGILASSPLLQMFKFENVSAFEAQLLLRVQDILITAPVTSRGIAAPSRLTNQIRIAYVDTAAVPASEGFIGRAETKEVIGKAAQTTVQGHTLKIGVAQINLTSLDVGNPAPRPVVDVIEIGS